MNEESPTSKSYLFLIKLLFDYPRNYCSEIKLKFQEWRVQILVLLHLIYEKFELRSNRVPERFFYLRSGTHKICSPLCKLLAFSEQNHAFQCFVWDIAHNLGNTHFNQLANASIKTSGWIYKIGFQNFSREVKDNIQILFL